MKSALRVIVFVVSGLLAATGRAESNGGRGGGDVISSAPASIAEIQNAVHGSTYFIRAWAQGVEGQWRPDLGISGPARRRLPLPAALPKLFSTFSDNLYGRLQSLQIDFRTASPCVSETAVDKDGSAVSKEENRICISGFTLSRKLTKANYAIQTEALILHEVAHLLGADEAEAISMQSQYLSDMTGVSKELLATVIEQTSEGLMSVSWSVENLRTQLGDWAVLCEQIYNVRSAVGEATHKVPISTIAVYTADQRDLLDELDVITGHMWQRYVCSRNPKHPAPDWLKEYNDGFAGKDRITVSEWLKNIGLQKVRTINQYGSVRLLRENKDLDESIQIVASGFKTLSWEVATRPLITPTVQIVE